MDYLKRLDETIELLEKEANDLGSISEMVRVMGEVANEISSEKKELLDNHAKLRESILYLQNSYRELNESINKRINVLSTEFDQKINNSSKEQIQKLAEINEELKALIASTEKEYKDFVAESNKELQAQIASNEKEYKGFVTKSNEEVKAQIASTEKEYKGFVAKSNEEVKTQISLASEDNKNSVANSFKEMSAQIRKSEANYLKQLGKTNEDLKERIRLAEAESKLGHQEIGQKIEKLKLLVIITLIAAGFSCGFSIGILFHL